MGAVRFPGLEAGPVRARDNVRRDNPLILRNCRRFQPFPLRPLI